MSRLTVEILHKKGDKRCKSNGYDCFPTGKGVKFAKQCPSVSACTVLIGAMDNTRFPTD